MYRTHFKTHVLILNQNSVLQHRPDKMVIVDFYAPWYVDLPLI